MTIAEMYAIRPDGNGWRQLPNGRRVAVGCGVTLGDGVILGDYVVLGDYVTLGEDVTLGDGVGVGYGVRLGSGVRLGNHVALGDRVRLGDWVRLGDRVRLGYGVRLGEKTEWTTSPLQIQGSRHLMYHAGPGLVGVGCRVYPIAVWEAEAVTLAEEHGYTPEQVTEYLRYFELMKDEDARRFPGEAV